jgi:hypothetical protein
LRSATKASSTSEGIPKRAPDRLTYRARDCHLGKGLPMTSGKCLVQACTEQSASWGMCAGHRERWDWQVRIPRTRLPVESDSARFNFYALRDVALPVRELFGATPDCWLWGGGLTRHGHGQFRSEWSAQPDGSVFAHLYSAVNIGGAVRQPLMRHTCGFNPCVNWAHVGRVDQDSGNRCGRGHELAPENVRLDRRGWRHCRTCDKLRANAKRSCPEGHEIDGDNVLREGRVLDGKISYIRRCRTCTRARQRNHYAQQMAKSGEVA